MNVTAFNPFQATANTRSASAPTPAPQQPESNAAPQDGFTPSEPQEKETLLGRTLKGACIGGAVGLLAPGIIVPLVGFAASPITGPLGFVLGAYAGAVSYERGGAE
ncbi:MAG: hypothetical protein KC910_09945 [Candidatus Eremiobacteraeota bacterium]|nr:hypothetical protein [Candidatus Eremiobacteraeota bacterium]